MLIENIHTINLGRSQLAAYRRARLLRILRSPMTAAELGALPIEHLEDTRQYGLTGHGERFHNTQDEGEKE